jgi:hypothetical protein
MAVQGASAAGSVGLLLLCRGELGGGALRGWPCKPPAPPQLKLPRSPAAADEHLEQRRWWSKERWAVWVGFGAWTADGGG